MVFENINVDLSSEMDQLKSASGVWRSYVDISKERVQLKSAYGVWK